MKPELQNRVLAGVEGYTREKMQEGMYHWRKPSGRFIPFINLPNYLDPDDHNPIQRIVDGMDELQLITYALNLSKIVRRDTGCSLSDSEFSMLKATVAQQVEAAIKALGLWEESFLCDVCKKNCPTKEMGRFNDVCETCEGDAVYEEI